MTMLIFPYFIPPLLAIIAAFFDSGMTQSVRRNVYHLLTLSGVLIYCCVYLNGTDWPAYEIFFENITWTNLFSESKLRNFELGFSFLLLSLKTIGFNFMISLIIMKVFSFIVISSFFYSFSVSETAQGYSKNIFLLLFIFYTTSCMYLYVETIIRFSLALAIVSRSYKYFLSGEFIIYLFIVLLAALFHRTVLIVIPLYFFREIKLPSISLFFLVFLIYAFFSPQMLLLVFKFINQYLSNIFIIKLVSYLEFTIKLNKVNPLAIGNIVHFLFFILVVIYRKKIECLPKHGKKIFAATIVFFIIYFATIYMGSVSRMRLLYNLFFIISLTAILSVTYVNRTFVFILCVCFWILGFYLSIDRNFCNKYYTNYITSFLSGNADLTFAEKYSIYTYWSLQE